MVNPFTPGLYLSFPFKKAQCFGVKILSVLVIKEKTESLEIYMQSFSNYTLLESKISISNVDWKISVAMATILNQSPLKSHKKPKAT